MGNVIGYARVSTNDQDLSLQLDDLKKAGCFNSTAKWIGLLLICNRTGMLGSMNEKKWRRLRRIATHDGGNGKAVQVNRRQVSIRHFEYVGRC